MVDGKRRKLLAVVHIAAKEARVCDGCARVCFSEKCPSCGEKTRKMSEFDYRKFLVRLTGHSTCRRLSNEQLITVIRAFEELGFERVVKRSIEDAMNDSRLSMIRRIENDARWVLGRNWKRRLNGFCRRTFGKDSLRFCSIEELHGVFGFLRRVQ